MIRSTIKRSRLPFSKDVPAVTPAPANAAALAHTGDWFCSKCLRRWPMREPHDHCKGTPADMDAVVVSKPIAANIGLRYQR